MNVSRTVYAIVGVFVAVLVIATVAVPVVEDAQDQTRTVYNNGTEMNFSLVDKTEPITIVKNANDSSITLNGVVVEKGVYNYLFFSEQVFIRLESESSTNVLFLGTPSSIVLISEDRSFNATFSGETLSYSINGATENTIDGITSAYVYAPDGDYVSAAAGTGLYVNDLAQLSTSQIVGTASSIVYHGVLNNGQLDVKYEEVEGYKNLFKVTGASATVNGSEIDFISFIVPKSVIGFTEVGGETAYYLLGVVVLILFLVPIMMIVRMIAGRSD